MTTWRIGGALTEAEIQIKHGAEFKRCLRDVDIKGIRRLWQHVSPHLPQPTSDDEALHTIHLARTKMPDLHPKLRAFSEQFCREREGRVAWGVGVSVIATPRHKDHALEVRAAMNEAVTDSIKAGVCLEHEGAEVKRRMMKAKDKV